MVPGALPKAAAKRITPIGLNPSRGSGYVESSGVRIDKKRKALESNMLVPTP